MKNHNINFKKQSGARRAAMQALYTWTISKNDLNIIANHYLEERNPKNINIEYFKILLDNIPQQQKLLLQAITKYSDRSLPQLDPIELSILQIATYEIIFQTTIPFKVIISEALELANMFGSDTSYKFINFILDRIAADYRKF